METNLDDRIKLVLSWLVMQGYGANQQEIGVLLGYNNKTYLSRLINGSVNNADFILRLCGLDNRLNVDWVRTGNGVMIDESRNVGDSLYTQMFSLMERSISILEQQLIDKMAIIDRQDAMLKELALFNTSIKNKNNLKPI